jgi:chemosensory pili system protein ChpC
VSVAEMLPYQKPQFREVDINSFPVWFLGNVRWRGVMVPMVSYEAVNGDDIPAIKGVSQMAILNNTGVNASLPFLCLPTQGIPRLSRVTSEMIKEDTSQPKMEYDEMSIVVNEEAATIPDLAKLEQAVVALLNINEK